MKKQEIEDDLEAFEDEPEEVEEEELDEETEQELKKVAKIKVVPKTKVLPKPVKEVEEEVKEAVEEKEEVNAVEPQLITIPRVVSETDMLNLLYDGQQRLEQMLRVIAQGQKVINSNVIKRR